MTAPLPRVQLAGDRSLALAVAAHARDAVDARLLLEALGLVAPVRGFVRPRIVPAHSVHTRSHYTPGCPDCQARNRVYVSDWRRRGGGRVARPLPVTPGGLIAVLDHRAGRGRHAAWPGQLYLIPEGETA